MTTETIDVVKRTEIVERNSPRLKSDFDLVMTATQSLQVTNDYEYQAAGDTISNIAAVKKNAENFFDPEIKVSHQLHKMLNDKKNLFIKPLDALRAGVENKMRAYKSQQREAADKLQRAADEQERQIRQKAADEALKLQRKGLFEQAAIAQEVATTYTAPPVAAATPKLEGVSESEPWTGQCVKIEDLIIAIAKGEVDLWQDIIVSGQPQRLSLLVANDSLIAKIAKRQGKEFAIPGCEAKQEMKFGVRR